MKIWIVRRFLPSAWIWLDEYFYAASAYDLGHPGGFGVPHTDFMFYPPLTSLTIAPVFFLDLTFAQEYRVSLVVLNAISSTTAVAVYLLYREIFGGRGAVWVAALALVGAPGYTALMLMSEPLFITLFAWLLYFLVRAVRTQHAGHFVAVGMLAGGMALTRRTGPGVLLALVVGFVMLSYWEGHRTRAHWRGPLLTIAIAVGIQGVGGAVVGAFSNPTADASLAALEYFRRGVLEPLSSVSGTTALLRRLGANLAYVMLATFGVFLPIMVWSLLRLGRRLDVVVRMLIVVTCVVGFVSAVAAAVHMTIYAPGNDLPRYDMFGRYMEHVTVPVIVLGMGLVVHHLSTVSARQRLELIIVTLISGVMVWVLVPFRFFASTVDFRQIAPNSLGVGALVRLTDRSTIWWVFVIVASMVLLASFLVGRSRRRALASTAGLTSILLYAAWNYQIAVSEISRKAFAAVEFDHEYAIWGAENYEIIDDGVCVDVNYVGGNPVGNDRAFYFAAEYIERVQTTYSPEACIGQMPVLTDVVFEGYEILFEDVSGGYRMYSTEPVSRGRSTQ